MYRQNHVPFLEMLAAIGKDEVVQPQPGGSGLQQHQQQQHRPGKVQLGDFWPQAPNSWFVAAELKFEVANITGEREHFAHVVGDMGFNVLRVVMDLVENPPAVNPYTTLKGRLVLAHQLTLVQQATKCLQVAASSNQRPSEVLAFLLEYCLPGEEGRALFKAAFTMRLPVTIQVHLVGTELTDLKELVQLADCLWQCNTPQSVAAVPAELQSDDQIGEVVAAMPAKKQPTNKHYKGQQNKPASSKAGKMKFIWFKHTKYGEDAFDCADKRNCTWSGN